MQTRLFYVTQNYITDKPYQYERYEKYQKHHLRKMLVWCYIVTTGQK